MAGYHLTSICHNEIRDLTANLMAEVCHNVSIEPTLQPITGVTFSALSANTEDGTQSDIAADGVWGGRLERTCFDVNPICLFPTTLQRSPVATENVTFKSVRLSRYHSPQLSSPQLEAGYGLQTFGITAS